MQQRELQNEIIKLIQDIKSLEKLKIIYQFIRGIRSGR